MAEEVIVTIQDGQLKGRVAEGYRGGKYFSFQGIPYAKPPIGELRFKAPLPSDPWNGIRDATIEGPTCYAKDMVTNRLIGSENCLFLNVYTPELPGKCGSLKPVMVWIHGGAFVSGSGNTDLYGPDYLLPEDVVVVTLNYRLGLLGFINFDDPSLEVPGNAGLKDQVMALRWVHKNISQFCGDPNNVTIFGESAGGVSTHLLTLSPTTKGLFHKAIVQSASALCYWARAKPSAPLIAKVLNVDAADEKKLVELLKTLPIEKLLEIQEKIEDSFMGNEKRPFCPAIEKPSRCAFLCEEPMNLMVSGRYNKTPLIIGYNSNEGLFLNLFLKMNYKISFYDSDLSGEVPHVLKIKDPGILKSAGAKIGKFYFGDEGPSQTELMGHYRLQTDSLFLRDIVMAINVQLTTLNCPIYFYRMSVESSLNMFKVLMGIKDSGAAHGDDLGYVFRGAMAPPIRPRSVEDVSTRRFAKLWTTFARHGDPNPPRCDPLINITWRPVEKGRLHFLDIGDNLTVGINPEEERMKFWRELYDQYCK